MMADAKRDRPVEAGEPPWLTEADRRAVERLAEGIAERSRLRTGPASVRAGAADDSRRARLARNQLDLTARLEDVLTSPAMRHMLERSSRGVAALRAAGGYGTWSRDVVPAIKIMRSMIERDQIRQREQAIGEAVRLMVACGQDKRTSVAGMWLETLEMRVRASLGSGLCDTTRVTQRLNDWAQQALSEVPAPVATPARTALVRHLAGAPLDEMLDQVPRTRRHDQPAGPVEPNRVMEADDRAGAPAAGPGGDGIDEQPVREQRGPQRAGLLARLHHFWSKRGGVPHALAHSSPGDDGVPQALRRRYSVHVSADRKTIALFEPGAEQAAITLTARLISTPHEGGRVIADVVLLARERGWQTLKVRGTTEFRDAIWLEARKIGLGVQHEPSPAVQAAYNKWNDEQPINQVRDAGSGGGAGDGARPREDLARAFVDKSPAERLADPRLHNAQLELMVGIRSAEKALRRPIADMPDVAHALAAVVREQLARGRMFDAPFVRPPVSKPATRQVTTPRIEADRIRPPRP